MLVGCHSRRRIEGVYEALPVTRRPEEGPAIVHSDYVVGGCVPLNKCRTECAAGARKQTNLFPDRHRSSLLIPCVKSASAMLRWVHMIIDVRGRLGLVRYVWNERGVHSNAMRLLLIGGHVISGAEWCGGRKSP